MKRGDIVTVSTPGAYGKPRPAVIVQTDWLDGTNSVLVSLMTSTVRDAPIFRLSLDPSPGNGLRVPSQIMVDKILALPRDKCGAVIRFPDDPFGLCRTRVPSPGRRGSSVASMETEVISRKRYHRAYR